MRQLYDTTKKLAGKYTKPRRPPKDKEVKSISEIQEMRKGWTEHFEELLTRSAPLNPPSIGAALTGWSLDKSRVGEQQGLTMYQLKR
ncbi:unnamed protein product [Schistosoma margrebowiei]|uniref:Uncharacterized protein n=1 Tax=Schistosoma margrebowiei TaxID=48269 RepID=A0A183N5M5_9TREM|nr:unnamed protein product [Schistosoma margrebowiei]